jgi:hypothetical protein
MKPILTEAELEELIKKCPMKTVSQAREWENTFAQLAAQKGYEKGNGNIEDKESILVAWEAVGLYRSCWRMFLECDNKPELAEKLLKWFRGKYSDNRGAQKRIEKRFKQFQDQVEQAKQEGYEKATRDKETNYGAYDKGWEHGVKEATEKRDEVWKNYIKDLVVGFECEMGECKKHGADEGKEPARGIYLLCYGLVLRLKAKLKEAGVKL